MGGGWVFGDTDTHDRLVRELVVGSCAVAVFPVYDLAPEAKYAAWLREAGVDVTAVRALGMVHDILVIDSLRDTHGTRVARHLAIDALKTARDN
jgi:acetyl esterase/lipase